MPVARLFFLVEGVFVSSELGVNSIAELKTLAQAKPDALNYATLGEGSYPDLFLKWMNNQWGTTIVGIPYRGGGPAAQAVAANQVQVTRFGVGNFLGAGAGRQGEGAGGESAKRSPVMPDVPTFNEVGWGDYPGQGWWGLAAPKGTPPAIVARLSAEFQKLFSDPKFMAFLEKQAVVPAATDAGRVRRVPQGGPQERRDADQDREHEEDGIQGIAVIRAEFRPP